MQINKKGLLYRLALWGTLFEDHEVVNWHTGETDICRFTRKVLLGIFWFIPLFIGFGALIGVGVGMPFFFLFLWAMEGIFISEFFIGLGIVLGVTTLVVLFVVALEKRHDISYKISKLTDKSKDMKEFKSFIKTNYDAWHDKTCFLITTKG